MSHITSQCWPPRTQWARANNLPCYSFLLYRLLFFHSHTGITKAKSYLASHPFFQTCLVPQLKASSAKNGSLYVSHNLKTCLLPQASHVASQCLTGASARPSHIAHPTSAGNYRYLNYCLQGWLGLTYTTLHSSDFLQRAPNMPLPWPSRVRWSQQRFQYLHCTDRIEAESFISCLGGRVI